MAVAHKSVISFGLVAIPIAMYTATQDNDIRFNQLHKEDQQRIRYKKVCGHCNKEVTAKDIIKGYQYDPDHYVVVTDEEIEKIKTEKDKSIQILHFAQLKEISPIYYNKTYYTAPEVGGEKAFELLRAALLAEGKVAIGKTVLGSKETLLAIIPGKTACCLRQCTTKKTLRICRKAIRNRRRQKLSLSWLLHLSNLWILLLIRRPITMSISRDYGN